MYEAEPTLRTSMTKAEQLAILETTENHRDGMRDHVIYSCALGCGAREFEIQALNVGQVFSDAGTAKRIVTLDTFKNSERYKRDAQNRKKKRQQRVRQRLLLPDAFRYKLSKYYAWKIENGEDVSPSAPMFLSRLNKRISTRTMRHNFGVWQERAALERRFTFHELRHTYATNLVNDINVFGLRDLLRHESVNTTMTYVHNSDEELMAVAAKARC